MNTIATFCSNPNIVTGFQKLCGVKFFSDQANNNLTENSILTEKSADKYPKKRHANNTEKLKNSEDTLKINYKVTNLFLHVLFHTGAFLCNEGFYVIVFPFLFYNVDQCAFRHGCYFWSLVMYIGQAAKDIIKQPRPPSPPVARLESRYDTEYGMPSTHAMMGTAMPFALFHSTYLRYQVNFALTNK